MAWIGAMGPEGLLGSAAQAPEQHKDITITYMFFITLYNHRKHQSIIKSPKHNKINKQ